MGLAHRAAVELAAAQVLFPELCFPSLVLRRAYCGMRTAMHGIGPRANVRWVFPKRGER